MKAFVLKNNKGLYYTTHLNYEEIHTENIHKANIFNREIANNVKLFLDKTTYGCNEKWEVAEITIAEGDLEQQLAEKDKEIKSLEQQIENNQRDYVSELAYYTAEENAKEIRKEICEKIKNLIDICFDAIETTNENGTKYSKEFSFKKFNAIINAIERGEQQ